VRVRAAQARIGVLQAEVLKMNGSSKALPADDNSAGANDTASNSSDELYPPLRQLPRLAVPYANLYREIRVQETVYELLTQQYEMARIQEAKDVPVVSVIDSPGIPEKKSFPPRLLLALLLTIVSASVASVLILIQDRWLQVPVNDPGKALALQIGASVRRQWMRVKPGGAR
jgi:capsule polysaccharide export protein KpsE/RkpR